MVLIIFFEEKFVQTYDLVFPGRIIEIKPKMLSVPGLLGVYENLKERYIHDV